MLKDQARINRFYFLEGSENKSPTSQRRLLQIWFRVLSVVFWPAFSKRVNVALDIPNLRANASCDNFPRRDFRFLASFSDNVIIIIRTHLEVHIWTMTWYSQSVYGLSLKQNQQFSGRSLWKLHFGLLLLALACHCTPALVKVRANTGAPPLIDPLWLWVWVTHKDSFSIFY